MMMTMTGPTEGAGQSRRRSSMNGSLHEKPTVRRRRGSTSSSTPHRQDESNNSSATKTSTTPSSGRGRSSRFSSTLTTTTTFQQQQQQQQKQAAKQQHDQKKRCPNDKQPGPRSNPQNSRMNQAEMTANNVSKRSVISTATTTTSASSIANSEIIIHASEVSGRQKHQHQQQQPLSNDSGHSSLDSESDISLPLVDKDADEFGELDEGDDDLQQSVSSFGEDLEVDVATEPTRRARSNSQSSDRSIRSSTSQHSQRSDSRSRSNTFGRKTERDRTPTSSRHRRTGAATNSSARRSLRTSRTFGVFAPKLATAAPTTNSGSKLDELVSTSLDTGPVQIQSTFSLSAKAKRQRSDALLGSRSEHSPRSRNTRNALSRSEHSPQPPSFRRGLNRTQSFSKKKVRDPLSRSEHSLLDSVVETPSSRRGLNRAHSFSTRKARDPLSRSEHSLLDSVVENPSSGRGIGRSQSFSKRKNRDLLSQSEHSLLDPVAETPSSRRGIGRSQSFSKRKNRDLLSRSEHSLQLTPVKEGPTSKPRSQSLSKRKTTTNKASLDEKSGHSRRKGRNNYKTDQVLSSSTHKRGVSRSASSSANTTKRGVDRAASDLVSSSTASRRGVSRTTSDLVSSSNARKRVVGRAASDLVSSSNSSKRGVGSTSSDLPSTNANKRGVNRTASDLVSSSNARKRGVGRAASDLATSSTKRNIKTRNAIERQHSGGAFQNQIKKEATTAPAKTTVRSNSKGRRQRNPGPEDPKIAAALAQYEAFERSKPAEPEFSIRQIQTTTQVPTGGASVVSRKSRGSLDISGHSINSFGLGFSSPTSSSVPTFRSAAAQERFVSSSHIQRIIRGIQVRSKYRRTIMAPSDHRGDNIGMDEDAPAANSNMSNKHNSNSSGMPHNMLNEGHKSKRTSTQRNNKHVRGTKLVNKDADLEQRIAAAKARLSQVKEERERKMDEARTQLMQAQNEKLRHKKEELNTMHREVQGRKSVMVQMASPVIMGFKTRELRQQRDRLKEDLEDVTEKHERLLQANRSASESFDQLNESAKSLKLSNDKLLAKLTSTKNRLLEYQQHTKQNRSKLRKYAHARVDYQAVIRSMHMMIRDGKLPNSGVIMQKMIALAQMHENEAQMERRRDMTNSAKSLVSPLASPRRMSTSVNHLQFSAPPLTDETKQVRFHETTITEFPVIRGDNPSCSQGCPIALDPVHSDQGTWTVDDFQSVKEMLPSRRGKQLVMSSSARTQLLTDAGYSRSEIAAASLRVLMDKKDRAESVFQSLSDMKAAQKTDDIAAYNAGEVEQQPLFCKLAEKMKNEMGEVM